MTTSSAPARQSVLVGAPAPAAARSAGDAGGAVDARSLSRRSRAELDALFATLPPPGPGDLAGDLRGVQIDLAGLERLPRALRAAILAGLRSRRGLWRGKRFARDHGTDRGTNLWALGPIRRSFAEFRVTPGDALDGSGACVRLDYDVPENAFALRGILGEVRTLGPALFLARMHYRIGSGRRCLLYFTLEA